MHPRFFVRLFMLMSFFLTAPCLAAKRINVTSVSQVDMILKSSPVVTYSDVVLVWNPSSFQTPEEAQKMLDLLRLARAWGLWIDSDGKVVRDFIFRTRVFFVGEVATLDDEARSLLFHAWFEDRLKKNPDLSDLEVLLLKRLPPEFEFLRKRMKASFDIASDRQTALAMEKSPMFRRAYYGYYVVENEEATGLNSVASLKRCESLFFARPRLRGL